MKHFRLNKRIVFKNAAKKNLTFYRGETIGTLGEPFRVEYWDDCKLQAYITPSGVAWAEESPWLIREGYMDPLDAP